MYQLKRQSNGEGIRTWYPDLGLVGFFNRVRGSATNNILVVGDFGTVAHYNGASWHLYREFLQSTGQRLVSVSVIKNQAMIVGEIGSRAIVYRGRR